MASRKEEKEKRRGERLEREQQRQQSVGRRKKVGFAIGGLAVIAAVVVAVILIAGSGGEDGHKAATSKKIVSFKAKGIKPPVKQIKDLKEAAAKAGCKLGSFRDEGREHLRPGDKPPKYKTNPPTSGLHDPEPIADGAYSDMPENFARKAVHSLEHGRVVIQYRNITSKQQRQLKGLFDEDDYHLILMPNLTEMPYQVAAVAWTKLLTCKKMNASTFDAIRAFVDKNVDQGPELVP